MKFTYHFVNDEAAEIEIPEEWGAMILELDGDEKNNNRKHSRRRPVSLENANYEGEWFADGTDILGDLIRREDGERLRASISILNPGQQELIHRIYFLEEKVIRVAEEQGVTEAAIRDRLKKIYRRLQKNLQ